MLAVVGLLVVGGGLVASERVADLLSSQHVRETTAAVRGMPLPAQHVEWPAACGLYGIWCARTAQEPAVAAAAVAGLLRDLGHDVPAARCGTEARIDPGTTLASVSRHDSQCTTTTSVGGGRLTVAAWDHVSPGPGGSGAPLDLGRTAVVVEWDSAGTELLLVAEPAMTEARFGDVRITPEEVAGLPGALAAAQCQGHDADGCLGYETELEGPGERRDLVEAWAAELLDAGFLVTDFVCDEDVRGLCYLAAEAGRADGEATRLGVAINVDLDDGARATAMVFTA